MQAVANNPEFAKKVGVPTKVGKEFTKETKVKKYEDGGKIRTKTVKTPSGRDLTYETNDEIEAADEATRKAQERYFKDVAPKEKRIKSVKSAPKSGNPAAVMKKKGGKIGMGMTKNNYKTGGSVSSCSKRADGCAIKGKTKGRMV